MGFMNVNKEPAETVVPVVEKKVFNPVDAVNQGFKEGKDNIEVVDMKPLMEESDIALINNELREDVKTSFHTILKKYGAVNTKSLKDMFIGYFDSVTEETKIDLIEQMERDII